MINLPLDELIDKAGGCRYMLVTAVSQRARQLQCDQDKADERKTVSVAVDELYHDQLDVEPPKEYYQD
ncbi:MAG: DNA-directed RNA polymerase subunit omega [Clostridia bacterium]